MARVSAWMASATAVMVVLAALWNIRSFDFGSLGPLIAASLLSLGAWRTLRAMSGGLRLLCGAWGIAFGLAWYAPSYGLPNLVPGELVVLAPVLVSAIGLALVVLHKEKKA